MDNDSLNVLHDDELHSVLMKLGLLEKIEKGELKCKYCQKEVGEADILALVPNGNGYKVVLSRFASTL